jgi:hypothetical protein
MLAKATDICFFHANCRDGALAAALLKLHHPGVVCVPCWKEKLPPDAPDLAGKNVLFVDLTPDSEVLAAVLHRARAVLVIDHHASELGTLQTMLRPGRFIYNASECGASLTWRWIHGMTAPVPLLVQYVRALDLFDWDRLLSRDPEAVSVCRAIEALVDPDVATMLALLSAPAEDVIARMRTDARIVMRVVDPEIAKALRSMSTYVLYNARAVKAGVINSMHHANWIAYKFYAEAHTRREAGPAPDDGAEARMDPEDDGADPDMSEDAMRTDEGSTGAGAAGGGAGSGAGSGVPSTSVPHVIWVWYQKKGGSIVVALKSNGSFDCQQYAKLFGGGGHPNSASFTVRDHAHMGAHLLPLSHAHPPHPLPHQHFPHSRTTASRSARHCIQMYSPLPPSPASYG